MKRIISLLTCIILIFSLYIPSNAAGDDRLVIKFQIGSEKIFINGKVHTTAKPYISSKTILVPLRPILEAYGAEINPKTKGNLNLVYRDVSVDITIGSKSYTVNDVKKILSAAPVIVNKDIMAPVQFITDNFGGKLSSDKNKKSYTLILEDDGAISDFSTVIGSIGKPRVGNSYFGWTISIPKGSQIVSNSFSSKCISIENVLKEFSVDVDVSIDDGKKLEEISKKIKENKNNYPEEFPGKIQDVYVNSSNSPACVEILGYIGGKGATIKRLIISNGYTYKVSVSTKQETSGQKIKEKTMLMNVLNSFKLGYKGAARDVYETSKVKENKMARYIDNTYGLSMDVLPEWDVLNNYNYSSDYDSYSSLMVGASNKEYISIDAENVEKVEDMDKYLDNIKAEYETLYNPKNYSFKEKKTIDLQNMKIYKLSYTLLLKDKKYILEDNFIMQDGVLFNITLKCPEQKFELNRDKYSKIFESIKYDSSLSVEDLKKLISSKNSSKEFSRVGTNDTPTDYEDNTSKWKLKIPGYWMMLPEYEDNTSTKFYNEKTESYIGIETVKNTSALKSLDDESKFGAISSILEEDKYIKLVDKKSISEKGTTVRQYLYQYDNDDEEVTASVVFYVVDGTGSSYCFYYMLPELYTTEKSLKEIEDIWDSFSITQ